MKKNTLSILLCVLANLSVIGLKAEAQALSKETTDPKHRVWDMVKGIVLEKKGIFTRKAYALRHNGHVVALFEPKLSRSKHFTMTSQTAKDWFHLYFYPSIEDLKKARDFLKTKAKETEWGLETSGDKELAEKDMPKIKSWVRRLWHWLTSFFGRVEKRVVIRGHHGIKDALDMYFHVYPAFIEKSEHEKKEVIDSLDDMIKKAESFSKKEGEQSRHLYEEYMAPKTHHHGDGLIHLHQHAVETLAQFGDHAHLALKHYGKCFRCFGEELEPLENHDALSGDVDNLSE